MKIYIFTILLSFSCLYSIAQNDEEKSLLEKLENTTSDSLKADIYTHLHNAVFKTDLDKSQEYAKKIIESGTKAGSLILVQRGYNGVARCERKRKNYEAVHSLNIQSTLYANKINHTGNLFAAYLMQARDYLDDDKPAMALQYLNLCKQLEKKLDLTYSGKLNQTFGWYYSKLNQHKKAIPYYRRSLQIYQQQNDEKMIAELQYITALTFLETRETDSVIRLTYNAMEIYKKRNSIGRQADCFGLLGKSYLINGNVNKGIEAYLNAIELFRLSQNEVQEALSYIDLARCYLIKKDASLAEKYGKQAEIIFQKMQYEFGTITAKTFWGQYFSEKVEFGRAEAYFKEADTMAKSNQVLELKLENEKYWAQHRYRIKNNKGADSLVYSYVKQLLNSKEANVINKDLAILLKKNPSLENNTVEMLKLLYSPGGADALQKKIGKKSLADISNIDSVLNLNPYSLASNAYDSAVTISDNKLLIEQETKFKTRLISDSLKIEKQNAIIAKEDVRQRNIILTATIGGLLLLSAGLWLQYRNRKRAERDKQHIQLLQNEIHHRVKNNLGVIQRLVDVAGKNAVDDVPLSSLKTRIKSIELLHTHLYSQEAKPGNISLQAYLEDLCLAIAATFETGKNIKINVQASEELNGNIAEKLGLIVNEVVTNSYKYAFEGKADGVINIIAQKDDKNIQIAVQDNGIGFETEKIKSNYGMRLIKGLSHELNAKYFFRNNSGTQFQLSIPV